MKWSTFQAHWEVCMPEIGRTFSHYRIVEKIGQGGMGEVYLADDLSLDRKVALKFLPEAFTGDPERMARFEREAKLLASLNHPNIAGIYGLEQEDVNRFLVLEHVEGETLRAKLNKGALPLEDALALCRQIAEGLEAAHEKGVIHRDLKPANVMITTGEKVKILDFGLAKALADETQRIDASQSPTLTEEMTRPGVILGTAAYMSPEQAKGKSIDSRTDIWAFGCILYECLTGKKAFEGETVTETLAEILRGEPKWELLQATIPSRIKTLLRRCLHKDKKMRIHDVADVRIELEEMIAAPPEMQTPTLGASSRWKWSMAVPWTLVVLLFGIVAFMSFNQLRDTGLKSEKPIRLGISLPKNLRISGIPMLSSDGSRIAFEAFKDNTPQLYTRLLAESEVLPLGGTEGALPSPFFSPDGKWIAFVSDRELKKVSIEGSYPQVLANDSFIGGTWCDDRTIVYTPAYSSGLWRIPSSGGDPEKLTEPEPSKGELGHWWPQMLPDGETILFTNYATPFERCSVAAYSLKSHQQKILVKGAMFGRYLPSGHLVFVRSETMLAAPFDLQRLALTGTSVPVLDDLSVTFAGGWADVSVSENGTLAYIRSSDILRKLRLVRFDRSGNINPINSAGKLCFTPKISPDGKRIAMTCSEAGRAPDIWTYDIQREAFTRITFGAASETNPLWTHDGKRLIYQSEQPQYDLYWKASDGTGSEELLLNSPHDKEIGAVSRNGKILIYSENNPETAADLWVLPLNGKGKAELWLQTPFNEASPSLSPDGNWLAYVTDESRRREVYIQPFPEHGERIQVSTEGGDMPVWSPNGQELFYMTGSKLMVVPVINGKKLQFGKPSTIFDFEVGSDKAFNYDISPDKAWFVGLQRDPTAPPDNIEIVLNWFEELKERVPVP